MANCPASEPPPGPAARPSGGATSRIKRSSVACRRCRRLRSKCVQDGHASCIPCRKAGPAIERACAFTGRGDNADRGFRIKRYNHEDVHNAEDAPAPLSRPADAEDTARMCDVLTSPTVDGSINSAHRPHRNTHSATNSLSPAISRSTELYSAKDVWSLLPPHEELLQGCRVFLTTCLQVGFIPKALFLEKMENSRESVNVFLLLSMLTISARFSPELCARFGGSKAASEFFMDIARVMVADQLWTTRLENTQAFFLLGMADWGRGDRDRSAINMGIAVRMAGIMKLHREETYALPPDAAADDVVNAERARRTFWVIQNHDNLYTQQHLPVSFAKTDITTLLPCEEADFAFGRPAPVRAALVGTTPALRDPSLTSLPSRSLFATLIQAHDLWGLIARDTYGNDEDGNRNCHFSVGGGTVLGSPPASFSSNSNSHPWDPGCAYQRTADLLCRWEQSIPQQHQWSAWNLRGYKAEHLDLAYLSVVTITRLNNIVLRRMFLESIALHVLDHHHHHSHSSATRHDSTDAGSPPGFWENMSHELFSNVWKLYEAIDVWFSLRSANDGFPAMLAFCTYICGSLACYVHKWPQFAPSLTPPASEVLARSLDLLSTFEDKWSTASEWAAVLREMVDRPPVQGAGLLDQVTSQEAMLSTSVGHSPDNVRSPETLQQRSQQHQQSRPRRGGAPPMTPYTALSTTSSPGTRANTTRAPTDADPAQNNYPTGTAPEEISVAASRGHTNNLHMLSDAAAYGAYTQQQQIDTRTGTYINHTSPLSFRHVQSSDHSGGGLPIASPTSPISTVFREPFDGDFADIVQGYVHLGWAGWHP